MEDSENYSDRKRKFRLIQHPLLRKYFPRVADDLAAT
jgi:hypothetical protein